MSMVLVTGGSGFVAGHVIVKLLAAGHDVRTTVHSATRERQVRASLAQADIDANDRLTFFEADLLDDDGWREAVAGCDYVIHAASPTACDGVLRILRAARDAKVQRVVLTSSCGAVYDGHPEQKAIEERAAWDFMEREGGDLELSVVNPVGIFGPALGNDLSGSLDLVRKLLSGMPGCPQLYFEVVDVRDVADLHVLAMTSPAAKNERFIAVSGEAISMMDIARLLRDRLGARAERVPTRQLPNWLVRVMAIFNPHLPPLLPLLGIIQNATSAKAERLLGWKPRSPEDALIATAESLFALGVV